MNHHIHMKSPNPMSSAVVQVLTEIWTVADGPLLTSLGYDRRADRIKHLFEDIVTSCKRFSTNYPPTRQDVIAVKSSLAFARSVFLEFSKDPQIAGGEDQWYELNSLYKEVILVSGQLYEIYGKVRGTNAARSFGDGRVPPDVKNVQRSFGKVKLNEDSSSYADAVETWKTVPSVDCRRLVKPPNVDNIQNPPKNVTHNYSDPNAPELWNQTAMGQVADLIEELLATPPPNESPEQILKFLSEIGDVVDQLDKKDGRVRKTYFPFYLAFRLIPDLLQCEFMKKRKTDRPPNVIELKRYLESYVRSIPNEEFISKAKRTQNPYQNTGKYKETNASAVWGNVAMGHVAEMIEELLEVSSPISDPEELLSFMYMIGDISKRLDKEDIKMRKFFLPFYLAFRPVPLALKKRFVSSRKATSIPCFGELRRFLVSYADPPQSTPWKNVFDDTTSEEFPNECWHFTIPRKPQYISMPSSPDSTSKGPPLIRRAEPSQNPVVFGTYRSSSQEVSSNGKDPVSHLHNICTQRKFKQPEFHTVEEDGPPHQKTFLMKVTVNGVDYQPKITSKKKQIAKSEAAKVCLRSLRELPNS